LAQFLNIIIFRKNLSTYFYSCAFFYYITIFVGKINFLSFLYKDRFIVISYILYCQIKTYILKFYAKVIFEDL